MKNQSDFPYKRRPFILEVGITTKKETLPSLLAIATERINFYQENQKYWQDELALCQQRKEECSHSLEEAKAALAALKKSQPNSLKLTKRLRDLRRKLVTASLGKRKEIQKQMDHLDGQIFPRNLAADLASAKLNEANQDLKFLESQVKNVSELVVKYRHWHNVWTRIKEEGLVEYQKLIATFDRQDIDLFTSVCLLAKSESSALASITGKAKMLIGVILQLARDGCDDALTELATIAQWTTREVNESAKQSPRRLNAYSRKCFEWPMMLSKKRTLTLTLMNF